MGRRASTRVSTPWRRRLALVALAIERATPHAPLEAERSKPTIGIDSGMAVKF